MSRLQELEDIADDLRLLASECDNDTDRDAHLVEYDAADLARYEYQRSIDGY